MNNVTKHKVHIKYEMKRKYGNKCMLTGKNVRLTYHHNCVKNCEDPSIENITVENGVLLAEYIHCYFLHCVIEKYRPELYKEIRKLLNRYKQALDNGDTEVIELIEQSIQPIFRWFQENQTEVKRRVRVYEKTYRT